MKINTNILRGILAAVILIILAVSLGMIWQKVSYSRALDRAKKMVANYNQYKTDQSEIDKVKKGDGDFFYYYAADGKRYVFPTIEVYRSWFGDYATDKLVFEDLQTMYKTPLGGNVMFRPGTLLKSPTLFDTYIAVKNGEIRPFANDKLLMEIYGSDWQKQVQELADYYFSQYQTGQPIESIKNFPDLPENITIDIDKGLK
jgi:hypothetical protein